MTKVASLVALKGPFLIVLAVAAVGADDMPSRIAGAALTRGGASAFLETLTDTVGGRVTGSPQNRAASELLLATLKEAGYANARFEEYPLESRWQHGPASGRIVSPIDRPILVGSYGWVPGTSGEISVPLADVGTPSSTDWMPSADRVRGAAVLVDPQKTSSDPAFVMRHRIARRLADAGAAAMLVPSDKPGRMLYTSAFGFYPQGPLPVLSVAKEDSLLLRRLLAKGPTKVSLDVRNTFDTSPYQERNVIADLPGGALADEVVLIGAHFDSWDPAQGADDDGSGVAAVLEAARILKSIAVTPRRTIRFAFFSGEEQACLGSRAYVAAHEKELGRLRTVLIMDEGAQVPLGFHIQGRADLQAAAKARLAPLVTLGAAGVSLDASFDQDHAPFVVAGVPAFSLWVEPGEYDNHHHTVTDTFDKVDPRLLAIDTAVMATAAWSFAESNDPVGPRLSETAAADLMKKTGVASTHRMVYGITAAEAAVPVGQEPLHKGVLKNDYVEVVHLTLPAGQATMLHTHSHDGVAVRLSKATVRIDVPGRAPTPPSAAEPGSVSAQAYAKQPMTHRVENVGTTPFEVIDIELLKRPPGPTVAPLVPPAAENDSARVYKWALAPGGSTPEHTHERPYVVIAATAMQLGMKAPDGRSMEHAVEAGDLHWVDDKVTHALSNQGKEAGVIVEVELK